MAPATGDYLVSCGVRLRTVYGATEFGRKFMVTLLSPPLTILPLQSQQNWTWKAKKGLQIGLGSILRISLISDGHRKAMGHRSSSFWCVHFLFLVDLVLIKITI